MKKLLLPLLLLAWSSAVSAAAEEIHLAARKGDVERVRALLDAGVPADLPSTLDTSFYGATPLFEAVKSGKTEVALLLLGAGADPNLVPGDPRAYESSASMAALYGRREILELFFDYGVGPDTVAPIGSLLHQARLGRQVEIEALLIERGASASLAEPSIEPLMRGADPERGHRLAKICRNCHVNPDDPSLVPVENPHLWNVVGREIGSQPGIPYSDAMKGFGGTWTYDNLNSFLASQGAFMPGTKMGFTPIVDVQDRADIIAYLRTLSDNPVPLP